MTHYQKVKPSEAKLHSNYQLKTFNGRMVALERHLSKTCHVSFQVLFITAADTNAIYNDAALLQILPLAFFFMTFSILNLISPEEAKSLSMSEKKTRPRCGSPTSRLSRVK